MPGTSGLNIHGSVMRSHRRASTLCALLLLAGAPGSAAPPLAGGGGGVCELAWTIIPSPEASEGSNALSGLGWLSDDEMWASGSYLLDGERHTLIERWDGFRWSIEPSPDGPLATNWLTGIAAVASDAVWVVGYSTDRDVATTHSVTLIERWDGESWKVIPSPNLSTEDVGEEFGGHPINNELFGIAAVSRDDIWAVGRSYSFSQSQELIVHWNGENWSVVPCPHPGDYGWLRGVAVVSDKDVWALGEHYVEVPLGEEGGVGSLQQNLIQHWDGVEWTVVESPNVGFAVNGLFGATVISRDDIWAVGYHLEVFGVNQVNHPSVLHWDGKSWTAGSAQVLNREPAYLFSIGAIATDEVYAVGFYDTGGPQPRIHTLIERWDGREWSIVPSLDPGDNDYLYALAPVSSDDIWAAGEQNTGEILLETLVERYTSSCIQGIFVRGDANGDDRVDISDAVRTLGHLFLGGDPPLCPDAFDADDSGHVEITDAIFVLEFLFQGGLTIPPPFPERGADPTSDDPYGCGQGA